MNDVSQSAEEEGAHRNRAAVAPVDGMSDDCVEKEDADEEEVK